MTNEELIALLRREKFYNSPEYKDELEACYIELLYHIGIKFPRIGDPRDFAHDTFIKILNLSYSDCLKVKNVRAWTHKIADNVVFDYLRKQHITYSLEDCENLFLQDCFENRYISEMIYKLLEIVDKQAAKIIVLENYGGYKQYEIAKIMHLSYVNVRVKVSRAKRKIKNYCNEHPHFFV